MPGHVVVPYDGSPLSKEALEFAIDTYPDAAVTALYVVDTLLEEPPERGFLGEDLPGLYEQREREGEERLEEARRRAEDLGTELDTVIEFGPAARNIVRYLDDHDVDHVVMGSHGRSGIERLMVGSVAETVARRSPVPVTIVK